MGPAPRSTSPVDARGQTWQWPPGTSDWRLVPKGGARQRKGSRRPRQQPQPPRRHHSAHSAAGQATHRRNARRGRSASPRRL
eukprot:13635584-Alexandrium_andersonii.AAC.1